MGEGMGDDARLRILGQVFLDLVDSMVNCRISLPGTSDAFDQISCSIAVRKPKGTQQLRQRRGRLAATPIGRHAAAACIAAKPPIGVGFNAVLSHRCSNDRFQEKS